jgi:hypothetical protein
MEVTSGGNPPRKSATGRVGIDVGRDEPGPGGVPLEVVRSVKEYASVEYEDAPEGSDARIVWSVILAMCAERLNP